MELIRSPMIISRRDYHNDVDGMKFYVFYEV